jgi:hypothetical protein
MEGIELKAAWHWGSDSSVIRDPLWEHGRTPLYVGFLSVWGPVDSGLMFCPFWRRTPFLGTPVDVNINVQCLAAHI